MQAFKEFRPSGFDQAGGGVEPGNADWLVLRTSQTRDSDALERSNFTAATERLPDEGDDVEIHRFGHWLCGWFEIIIVRPDTAAHAEALKIEAEMADYAALD